MSRGSRPRSGAGSGASTNFFERQRLARRDSKRLIALFGVAVAAIVIAVVWIMLLVLHWSGPHDPTQVSLLATAQERSGSLLGVAVLTLAAIGITSLVRAAQLSEGGAAIARNLGGTEIPARSTDLQHQRLRNVVEEIAIASGVPVPKIFVLEHEAGINAFAAGFHTADAAVAVTRGALEQLSRDELQGVIAHEFSHILNGDMRLNLRLIGWLAGITLLAVFGRILMRVRGRNAGGVVMFGVALLVIGSIGLFCARLIKAGISRKREYLADASAVQFTRQSTGIAGALKTIASHSHGSRLSATDGEEVSHLLFGDGVGYSALFATHPPLEQRIAALEPGFKLADLTQWKRQRAERARARAEQEQAQQERQAARSALPDLEFTRVLGEAGAAIPAPVLIAGLPAAAASGRVQPDTVVDQVAHPGNDDYRVAGALHEHLPSTLDQAAHTPEWVPALYAGLLLSDDARVQARQLRELERRFDAAQAQGAAALLPHLRSLHPMQRLPLAEIAFASLRRLPDERLIEVRNLVAELIAADGQVSLFEYCLGFLLRQQIDEALKPASTRLSGRASLTACQAEVGLVLSLLADAGHDQPGEAERAFAAGVAELGSTLTPRFHVPADWAQRLDPALAALNGLRPAGKSLLIAAMTRAVMHDGRIDVAESELLRTVCAALHCPLPPLLHEGDATVPRPLS